MRRLTVLIDMDDVLENLGECWVEELNRRHGTAVRTDDILTWDFAAAFPQLTREQVFSPLLDSAFWTQLSSLPGAALVLADLLADGHHIKVVTATDYRVVLPKMELLFRLYPFISWKDVIIASDKQRIRGDVLVDDGVHNLEGGPYAKLLFDRPHNRSYDASAGGMTRVFDWEDVYREITRLASKSAV